MKKELILSIIFLSSKQCEIKVDRNMVSKRKVNNLMKTQVETDQGNEYTTILTKHMILPFLTGDLSRILYLV